MTSNELTKQPSLAPIFQAACVALQQNREQINLADLADGNYGDQIVEVFQIAVEAAEDNQNDGLSKAMEVAGLALEGRSTNKAAQAYSIGLRQLALQLSEKGISLEELLAFVQQRLNKNQELKDPSIEQRSGVVIKALVSGLANWERVEQGKRPPNNPSPWGFCLILGSPTCRQSCSSRSESKFWQRQLSQSVHWERDPKASCLEG